ncbi:MAG: LytTR family DNA-binding domain-containing protein [Bacteroidales bacterium]|nr:LytTR family DNA-binding domain-containing protein [Bacteroidales bacterium]MDD4067945.1 LytTR family DNA-binding domain-containing protein [Bacteroidales bacterium]
MFENKRTIFIIIGFLIIWSLMVSCLLGFLTKENLLFLFSISFLSFGIFAYLLQFLLNKNFFRQEEQCEIKEIKEEKYNIEKKDLSKEYIERISVKTGQKLEVIIIKDVMFLQSNGDYVSIYSKENVYLKEQTMKYFEKNLPPKQFIRIHRCYIVNIDFISNIQNYKKNQFKIKLKNNYELKASQTGYNLLKERLSI